MKYRRSLVVALAFLTSVEISSAALDTAKIEEIIDLKGKWNEGEKVFKISAPRNDVKVSVDGWQMPAFMGLTSWTAFSEGMKAPAMVMGDLVLFADEVNPAMSAALEAGLSVTALHNHFFFDEPKVYFMHISGEGTAEMLAGGVKKVYDAVKAVREPAANPGKSFGQRWLEKGSLPEKNAITPAPLNEIFAMQGEAKDGMFKVVIGRKAKMPCGCEVGKEMGVNTWAAFAGTDDNAIVDGDFAMTEDELQPVLKSLRKAGINIVAIHQHMTHEEPRMMFLHYWGRGKAGELAHAVKEALAVTKHEQ